PSAGSWFLPPVGPSSRDTRIRAWIKLGRRRSLCRRSERHLEERRLVLCKCDDRRWRRCSRRDATRTGGRRHPTGRGARNPAFSALATRVQYCLGGRSNKTPASPLAAISASKNFTIKSRRASKPSISPPVNQAPSFCFRIGLSRRRISASTLRSHFTKFFGFFSVFISRKARVWSIIHKFQ